jgi:predicted molibdopterin-dependent oxidoreductase YjgC
MDFLETQTVKEANIVIPATPLAESQGTITSMDSKVHTFGPAFIPKPGTSGFSILTELFTKCTGKEPPKFVSNIGGNDHSSFRDKFTTVSGKAMFFVPSDLNTHNLHVEKVVGAIERYFLKTTKV